jgi:hypothetical protein
MKVAWKSLVKFSLLSCFISLVSVVAARGAEFSPQGSEFKVLTFVANGNSFKEVSSDLVIKLPGIRADPEKIRDRSILSQTHASGARIASASTYPAPTYFKVWPYAASTPEEQIYWYYRPSNTVYIAVASAVPTWPGSLPSSQMPYHQGQTAQYNYTTLYPNENLRHRLHMSLTASAVTFNIAFPLVDGQSVVGYVYMFMGNSANHVGYVHFYPLWSLDTLNPNAMPTASLRFIDPSGVEASHQIRFYPGTIYLVEWEYIP